MRVGGLSRITSGTTVYADVPRRCQTSSGRLKALPIESSRNAAMTSAPSATYALVASFTVKNPASSLSAPLRLELPVAQLQDLQDRNAGSRSNHRSTRKRVESPSGYLGQL